MKNEGILYVFLDFHSAQLGQKIRCSAEDDLFSASKRVMSENKKSTPIPGQTKTVFRDRSAQQREGHILAIKIVEESAVLSLDFWEEDVIYCGSSFPAGTLACHALNIPAEVVAQMTTICGNLNHFMASRQKLLRKRLIDFPGTSNTFWKRNLESVCSAAERSRLKRA